MTPQQLLDHHDTGRLWPDDPVGRSSPATLAGAYADALSVRALRIARGESPRGFKIGFTNRGIWPRYQVSAPIWGTVWDSSLSLREASHTLSLSGSCQPRIEPEAVFGLRATPPADASIDALFAAIEWVAPGFEIVQSHARDWKFSLSECAADGGLHARLMVGSRIAIGDVAADAAAFNALFAQIPVRLLCDGKLVDQGVGANVLDGPLLALQYFLAELRRCPGAPDLMPGDVVTTGTWTDAWPVAPGQSWQAAFGDPLGPLQVDLC